eukprot:gene10942-3648_t
MELNPSPLSKCSAYTLLLGCFTFVTMIFQSLLRGNQYQFLGAVLISVSIFSRTVFQLIGIYLDYTTINYAEYFSQLIAAIPVYQMFKWKLFNMVGTSPVLKRIDIDAAFVVIFIRFFYISFESQPANRILFIIEFVVLVVGGPISLFLGVRRENKIIHGIFTIASLILPVHLMYMIVKVWTQSDIISPFIHQRDYLEVKVSTTFYCLMCIFTRIVFLISCIQTFFYFNLGLKEKIYSKDGIFYSYFRSHKENEKWITDDQEETEETEEDIITDSQMDSEYDHRNSVYHYYYYE